MKNNRLSKNPDLYRMIYCSQITTTGMLGIYTLKNIIQQSAINNLENNITGALCYGDGCFLQYLEGSEQALTDLKNKLVSDTRHRNMKILDFSVISNRHFNEWLMKEVSLDEWASKDPAVNRVLPFNPINWDDEKLHYFIVLLKERYMKVASKHHEQKKVTTPQAMTQTLGMSLSSIINRHQAFLVVQTVLSILIALCMVMTPLIGQT